MRSIKNIRFLTGALLTLALIPSATGCARTTGIIHAANLRHKVSLSKALFDQRGRVVIPTEDQIVEHFTMSVAFVSFFFGVLEIGGGARDLSAALDKKIENASGDAIINLTFYSSFDLVSLLMGTVPVLPTYALVTISGDIVRLQSAGESVATHDSSSR